MSTRISRTPDLPAHADIHPCPNGPIAEPVFFRRALCWLFIRRHQNARRGQGSGFACPDVCLWGGYDAYAWFKADVTLPPGYAGRKVVLTVSVSREDWSTDSRQFILFVNGKIKQGVDVNHNRIVLCSDAKAGATYRLDLQAYAGLVEQLTPLELQLLVEDEAVKAVYYDLHVPCQVAAELPPTDKTRLDILQVLNQAIRQLDLRKPGSAACAASVACTRQFLYGKRYFRERFGRDNHILWLPDVFGYSAAISLSFNEAYEGKGTAGKIISQSIQNDAANQLTGTRISL